MTTKIFLGGIPLGCDNIGDEAILACVIGLLREKLGDVEITVATADPQTAKRLGVETTRPFGFAGTSLDGFAEAVKKCDAYVWCGATGLSDYPLTALDLLEQAQNAGVDTYIWGVGMDDELNPVFFRAHGKKKLLLRLSGLERWYERLLRRRLEKRISHILPKCKGVWLRDPQSADMLSRTGYASAAIAADTAILQTADGVRRIVDDMPSATPAPTPPRLGLCISTQRQVADLDGVRRMIDRVRQAGAEIIGIPMNPKTDRALLEQLGVECISGSTPEDVCKAAARCSLVLSSRLHLLILAANMGTRIMGIARGSKLANWLANFGLQVEGSVFDCDWDKTTKRIIKALHDECADNWDATRELAYANLSKRLESASASFTAMLSP